MSETTIVVVQEPAGNGWKAFVEDEPATWERADRIEQAIEKLIVSTQRNTERTREPSVTVGGRDFRRVYRLTLVLGLLVCLAHGGCAGLFTSFYDRVSPSGVPCSDLPVIPNGEVVGKEFHRLPAVASSWEAADDAARVESLRRAACAAGADGVVEVILEETRHPKTGMFVPRLNGTSVKFLRPRREGGDKADVAMDVNARVVRPRFPGKTDAPSSLVPRLELRP